MEAIQLVEDALLLQELGCFAVVLEKVPAALAEQITKKLKISTIGIGAGQKTDGQVLVTHDFLGMTTEFQPRFLRRYRNLAEEIVAAEKEYIVNVKEGSFPNDKEQY